MCIYIYVYYISLFSLELPVMNLEHLNFVKVVFKGAMAFQNKNVGVAHWLHYDSFMMYLCTPFPETYTYSPIPPWE